MDKFEKFDERCREEIDKAIVEGKGKVLLDFGWIDEKLKELATNPMTSFLLFSPGMEMDRKFSPIYDGLIKDYKEKGIKLGFYGVDGGSMCTIKKS